MTEYVAGAQICVRCVARSAKTVAIGQKNLACLFPAVSEDGAVHESGSTQRDWTHTHKCGGRRP